MRTRTTLASLLLAVSASAEPATAREPAAPSVAEGRPAPVPFTLTYTAPGDCPGRAAVASEILRRVGRAATLVSEVSPPRTPDRRAFEVWLAIDADGTAARLRLTDPTGRPFERHATATTCAELVDAMTLIAAFTLERGELPEPTAAAGAGAGASAESVAQGVSANPEAPAAVAAFALPDTAVETVPAAPPAAPPPPPSPPTHRPPPTATAATPRPWRAELGMELVGASPIGPELGFGPGLFVGIAGGRPNGLALAARLGGYRVQAPTVSVGELDAELSLSAARLTLCPVRLSPLRRHRDAVELTACAFGELGGYLARSDGPAAGEGVSLLWQALGLHSRAAVHLVGPLHGELAGGLVSPLLRDYFYIDEPDEVVHRIPKLGWTAALGLALWL